MDLLKYRRKKGKKFELFLTKKNFDDIKYDVHTKIELGICTYFYFRYEIVSLLKKTKYGSDGMGGIVCNGMMYVGFPR